MTMLQKIANSLPPSAQNELVDFAEFLQRKYSTPAAPWPEQADWHAMTEHSVSGVWDNTEDDVYAQLL